MYDAATPIDEFGVFREHWMKHAGSPFMIIQSLFICHHIGCCAVSGSSRGFALLLFEQLTLRSVSFKIMGGISRQEFIIGDSDSDRSENENIVQ